MVTRAPSTITYTCGRGNVHKRTLNIYTLNSVVSPCGNQSARGITEFCSVNMDAWYYRIRVACDTMECHKGDVRTIWIRSPVTYISVVHSIWSSRAMWRTRALTFNKWHKKKKKTHGAIRGCGLAYWVVYIYDKFRDMRERNVTIRSEIWTAENRSLGFWDIRECVTIRRLISRSLGCIVYEEHHYCINILIRRAPQCCGGRGSLLIIL